MSDDLRDIKDEFKKEYGYEPSNKELIEYLQNKADNFNPNKVTTGDKASGTLLMVWFIVSIISLIYFSRTERIAEMVLVFVHYFLVFGLLSFFASKKIHNIDWLFVVGLCFCAFLWLEPGGIKINMNSNMIMFAGMGFIFFIVGLNMLYIAISKIVKKKKYMFVNAIVCDYRKGRKGTKACVYEYEIDGKKYKVRDEVASNVGVPQIGTIKQIQVNPENHEEILTNASISFMFVLAIPFVLMGGLFLLVGLGILG